MIFWRFVRIFGEAVRYEFVLMHVVTIYLDSARPPLRSRVILRSSTE